MDFIKRNKDDLSKVIIVIEKAKTGFAKKIYNSLLDMPPAERDAYIAQAFAKPCANQATAEETWARIHLENLLSTRLVKNTNHR